MSREQRVLMAVMVVSCELLSTRVSDCSKGRSSCPTGVCLRVCVFEEEQNIFMLIKQSTRNNIHPCNSPVYAQPHILCYPEMNRYTEVQIHTPSVCELWDSTMEGRKPSRNSCVYCGSIYIFFICRHFPEPFNVCVCVCVCVRVHVCVRVCVCVCVHWLLPCQLCLSTH